MIDYRKLNDVAIKDSYPMPNVREIIDKMQGSRYFSKMDMASAYWAVPIKESDLEKTAFMTPRHLLEMCVTVFGLCNSQPTYQRIMDSTLEGLDHVDSFVDDVCAYTQTFDEMLETLRKVFDRMQLANLQMRVDKCHFGYNSIDFVGHVISNQGISPAKENIQAVLEFPESKRLKELVPVLGMASYYRDFVKNMADIVEPLSRFRREGQPFEWTEECKVAFSALKHSLTAPPVLIYPDWTKPFVIEADASDVAVGGTLSQHDSDDKVLEPIGYFSSSVDVHQRNYSAGERECWVLLQQGNGGHIAEQPRSSTLLLITTL